LVYTYLTGRIGNNLFQIATGASLAFRHNTNFIACITNTWCNEPDNCYLDEYLKQFETTLLRNIVFVKAKPDDAIVFDQVQKVEQIPYFDNICLHGLWQSENYFLTEQEYIRDLFSIDEATDRFIRNKYGHVLEGEIISIVVRRGDYVKQPQFHPTCSLSYYKNAMNYFGRNKRYLIISDDINWCKKKFKGSNFYFSDHDGPLIDLYLQTFCTHNIISNSSFAWWGAWLNPNPHKEVIVPKNNWFGYFYKQFYRADMFPDSWIQLANPLSLRQKSIVAMAIILSLLVWVKHFLERKFNFKVKIINRGKTTHAHFNM
jgi:hypothetical protein